MIVAAPFRVLLLGWHDAPRPGEVPPSVRPLVRQLAPLAPLAVLLPHLPRPAFAAGPDLRVTGLANLDLADALAPRPDQRPAAWQRPAAPYAGATAGYATPAAPYQGATPPTVVAEVVTTAPDPPAAPPSGSRLASSPVSVEAPGPAPLPESAAPDLLLNRDEFAPQVEPKAGEARELAPLANEPLLPRQPPPAASLPRVRATLTEALAALGVELPTAPDLNFQVIQYARFATRRAIQEDFAVIYAMDWPTWLAGLEIRQQTGRPLVLHVHDLAQERGAEGTRGWGLALERLALRRADLVLAASDEVARLLYERYQLPPERLRMVALTDTETLSTVLHQLENRLPSRPAGALFLSSTA